MNPSIIGLASDHAGYPLKEFIKTLLDRDGKSYTDFGTCSTAACNYAEYGHLLADAVTKGRVSLGIAVCGTGNGINMTVNKHAGIRSALCWNKEIARLARAHNDANLLALPGRFLSLLETEQIVEVFLTTPFEGGRHLARIGLIENIE
ncbi:MAG: ribose 5-phosphate isomerase B [Dysgonamonadaceae bacterium]|jgi:ribose 5-phosphate isomerase B|nr:ribose 5-phosphate isomerase B [Dysgonamonadaceae bacterium]